MTSLAELKVSGATEEDIDAIMGETDPGNLEHPSGPAFSLQLYSESAVEGAKALAYDNDLSPDCKVELIFPRDPVLDRLSAELKKAAGEYHELMESARPNQTELWVAHKTLTECHVRYLDALHKHESTN